MDILLVDDEVMVIDILKKAIDWKGLKIDKVHIAYNVMEAKDILNNEQIDILLCDIEMPHESGLKLIEWVKQHKPEIVSVILTGYADFSYAQSAVSLGVFKFLLKPIDFGELQKIISMAMQKVQANRVIREYEKYFDAHPNKYADINMDSGSLEGNTLEANTLEAGWGSSSNNPIYTVKSYIDSHYNEEISRSELEQMVHLNRDHINREFRKLTGYSLMEYIQFCRMVTAKKMLANPSFSIREICLAVGYDSPAYFSKLFKKWTGFSPVEYRKYRYNI